MFYDVKEIGVILAIYIIGIITGLLFSIGRKPKKKYNTFSTKTVVPSYSTNKIFDGKNPLEPYRQPNGLHNTYSARKGSDST